MQEDGDGAESPRTESTKTRRLPDDSPETGELKELLAAGPGLGNRAGALAFLTILAVLAAGLHFYLTGTGGGSFLTRLDSDLLTHAEMSMSARENGTSLTVVPSWPYRLYESLRRDVGWYAAAAALAAILWGLSVQARGKRSAYLVHEKLTEEIITLRRRVEELERCAGPAGKAADDLGAAKGK